MVFRDIGKYRCIVFNTGYTFQRQRVGGNLHHHILTARFFHAVQELLEIHYVRCGIVGYDGFFVNQYVDGTDHAAFIACAFQYLPDDIGAGSLSVGPGHSDHTHSLAGIIKKERHDDFHCFAHILNLQQR